MKYLVLVLKILVFMYMGYLVAFFLMTDGPAASEYHPPFVLWLLDTMNLFIHEAGHFFLKPLGMWIYIFGGSLVQCFLPLALAVVTWRQSPAQVPFPAFWFGENLINVSYYIKDAPYKHLRLLAAGLIHDWNWLLSNNLDSAGEIGGAVWGLGILICTFAVGAGVYSTVRNYMDFQEPVEE